jgi:hypothetical protein
MAAMNPRGLGVVGTRVLFALAALALLVFRIRATRAHEGRGAERRAALYTLSLTPLISTSKIVVAASYPSTSERLIWISWGASTRLEDGLEWWIAGQRR